MSFQMDGELIVMISTGAGLLFFVVMTVLMLVLCNGDRHCCKAGERQQRVTTPVRPTSTQRSFPETVSGFLTVCAEVLQFCKTDCCISCLGGCSQTVSQDSPPRCLCFRHEPNGRGGQYSRQVTRCCESVQTNVPAFTRLPSLPFVVGNSSSYFLCTRSIASQFCVDTHTHSEPPPPYEETSQHSVVELSPDTWDGATQHEAEFNMSQQVSVSCEELSTVHPDFRYRRDSLSI